MAQALELAAVRGASVARVLRGAPAAPVVPAGTPLQALAVPGAGAGGVDDLVLLAAGAWTYPLCEQLVLKANAGVYILPAGTDGALNYVLRLDAGTPAEDEAAVDAVLAAHASLRRPDGSLVPLSHAPPELAGEPPSAARPAPATAAPAPVAAAAEASPAPAPPLAAAPAPPTAPAGGGALALASAPAAALTAESAIGAAVNFAVAGGRAAVAAAPAVLAASSELAASTYSALPQSVKDTKAADVGSAASRVLLTAGALGRSALVAGAKVAGGGLRIVGDKLSDALGRADAPTRVSAETHARVQQAAMVGRAAVTISSSLVAGAATVAVSLGRSATAAFAETDMGKRAAVAGSTEVGKAVKLVTASGLVAFGDVWDGLNQAAVIVGADAGAATKSFVERRYGAEAGATAARAVDAAGDVGLAALHMNQLGLGGMLRRTAVEVARDTLADAAAAGGGGGAGAQPVARAITDAPAPAASAADLANLMAVAQLAQLAAPAAAARS